MSSTMNNGLKALACGMGALAITALMSWSLVTSTSGRPGAVESSHSTPVAKIVIQQRHVWFGQAAVLVD